MRVARFVSSFVFAGCVSLSVGAAEPAKAPAKVPEPSAQRIPAQEAGFKQAKIIDVWDKYAGVLTMGKGQTLALVDDGCKPNMPEWNTPVDGVSKVIAQYDAIDGDDDPAHGKRGYHGSTIGVPSSLNYRSKRGVAYNNQVAIVRGVECCHCNISEGPTLAKALQWVLDNHKKYNITTVNLAPVDDKERGEPSPTEIDAVLAELRKAGIWVSAPAGNHKFVKGISWPACQPNCIAVGGVTATDAVYLDRSDKIELMVPAAATSSSNAIACGAAMILREAIEKAEYDWKADGANLPEAMLKIMQTTGKEVVDTETKKKYRRLDLLAAIDHVAAKGKKPLKASP